MASKEERARQFLPFDALRGFREALKEKEKIVVLKKELSEDEIENLSYKLNQVKKGMIVCLIYYEKSEYIRLEGIISNVDFNYHYLMVVDKKINFEDIYELSSDGIVEKDILL